MSDVKERDPILWLGDATPDADVWELTRWPGVMILGGPTILYLKADPPVAVPAGWWICDNNGRPFAASRPVRAARAESEGTPASDAERWERGQSHFCLTCGKLPPHEGCSAVCPACAPANGTCGCAGCTLVETYRLRLEVLAEEARAMAGRHDMSQPGHVADLESLAEFADAPVSRDGQARNLPVRTARQLSGDDLRDAARRLSPQPAMEDYEDASRDGQGDGTTCALIVNGSDVSVPTLPDDRIGVLAHRALAAEGYDWLTIELRDGEGRLLSAGTRAADILGVVYVGKPIGWGG